MQNYKIGAALAAVPLLALSALSAVSAHAAGFTAGDIVVYRVGDGSASLSSAGTAVFLDEYTTAGALVQSIAMPTTASGSNYAYVDSGSATSDGELNLSSNGAYLAVASYNAGVGTTGVATSSTTSGTSPVARVVGIIGADGSVDTSTLLAGTNLNGNNIRGAYTTDGNAIYVVNAVSGVDYTTKGSASATTIETGVTNGRDVLVANGQLYASTASGSTYRIFSIGSGTPTTGGQTDTELPGLPTTGSAAPYAFSLLTLQTSGSSLDTLYLADNGLNSIDKYSLVGGTWTETGTVTGLSGVTGITAALVGGSVKIYATTPNSIYSLTDTSGYDGTLSGSAASIVSAATNTAFRGIAFAPQAITTSAASPEPGAAALLLAGAGMLPLLRRRHRKTA